MSERWRIRCPFGHTQIKRRTGMTEWCGTHGSKKQVPVADGEYYCRTCADDRERYGSPHYESHELNRLKSSEQQSSLGYVWSPSHDE
jgi:hypothetical protein